MKLNFDHINTGKNERNLFSYLFDGMDTKRMKIVICGGGNGSHASVATAGSKSQFEVCVFTRRPSDWKSSIKGLTKGSCWEDKGDFNGSSQLKYIIRGDL